MKTSKQSKSILNAKAKIRKSVGSQMISINFKQGDFIPENLTVGLSDYKIIGNFNDGFFAMYLWQNEQKIENYKLKHS